MRDAQTPPTIDRDAPTSPGVDVSAASPSPPDARDALVVVRSPSLRELCQLYPLDPATARVTLGRADAVLAASIFHFGDHTVREAKELMRARGIEVRL